MRPSDSLHSHKMQCFAMSKTVICKIQLFLNMQVISLSLYLGFPYLAFHCLENPFQTLEYEKLKQKNIMRIIWLWFLDAKEKILKLFIATVNALFQEKKKTKFLESVYGYCPLQYLIIVGKEFIENTDAQLNFWWLKEKSWFVVLLEYLEWFQPPVLSPRWKISL